VTTAPRLRIVGVVGIVVRFIYIVVGKIGVFIVVGFVGIIVENFGFVEVVIEVEIK
jgi:hypothetical protein